MTDKEADIVGLLNMMTRIAQKVLPEALPEVDRADTAQRLRGNLPHYIREVQPQQVKAVADRFTDREVDEILRLAESPLGQRILEAIPVVSYYPIRDAMIQLADGYLDQIEELQARIRELEAGKD